MNSYFSDMDGDAEVGTTYQWQLDGVDIPGANENIYQLEAGDGNGRQLRVGVTPKTDPIITDPHTGVLTWSAAVLTRGTPPQVSELTITGKTVVGETLYVNYVYSDADGDLEDTSSGGTEFRWYRNDRTIGGSSYHPSYQLVREDIGYNISVLVIPRSLTGDPRVGVPVMSPSSSIVTVAWDIEVTKDEAVSDGRDTNEVTVKVTDAYGTPVPQQAVTFTASNGATIVNSPVITDANGMAVTTLTNVTAGVSAVTATVNGGSQTVDTNFVVVPALTGVSVNGYNNSYNFALNAGFPSTGFTGARFTLSTTGKASDYTWTSSTPWVSVDNSGQVSFTSQGNASPVTITATPAAGGAPLTYTFTINSWFIVNSIIGIKWNDAANWCSTQGLRQATRAELTRGTGIRAVGSLYSEWADMHTYGYHWTSEANESGGHYRVDMNSGTVYSDSPIANKAMCRQSL